MICLFVFSLACSVYFMFNGYRGWVAVFIIYSFALHRTLCYKVGKVWDIISFVEELLNFHIGPTIKVNLNFRPVKACLSSFMKGICLDRNLLIIFKNFSFILFYYIFLRPGRTLQSIQGLQHLLKLARWSMLENATRVKTATN